MPLPESTDDLFSLRPDEPPWYGNDPDIEAGTNYFKSLIPNSEWVVRRKAAAERFYRSLVGDLVSRADNGRLYNQKDFIAWYLFLGEAFNNHPINYEVHHGSRIVPVLAAIGRNIHLIEKIDGFRDRALKLIGEDQAQPNGPLFEMLVALAYAREGHQVAFHPETPGKAKAHDLDVTVDGTIWAVECKRMEAGDYAENELQRMNVLWDSCKRNLVKTGCNIYLEVNFKIELDNVPDDYFSCISNNYLHS